MYRAVSMRSIRVDANLVKLMGRIMANGHEDEKTGLNNDQLAAAKKGETLGMQHIKER